MGDERARLRRGSLLCQSLFFIFALDVGCPASAAQAQEDGPLPVPAAPEPLTLELLLGGETLSDDVSSFRHAGGVLLPLGQICRLLELGVEVQADGVAQGFLIKEDRRFYLDAPHGQIHLPGKEKEALAPGLVEVREDDLYVDSKLLSQWLPADFQFNPFALSVKVSPREPLPFQMRHSRELQAQKLKFQLPRPDFPRIDTPYRLWGGASVSPSLLMTLLPGPGGVLLPSAQYNTYVTAEILHMNTSLYLTGSERQPLNDLQWTMGRKDPDGEMLGFLKAREVSLGNYTASAMPLVSRPQLDRGVLLSNFPLNQQSQFDSHNFRGSLPPGWEIELYRDNALLGYQPLGADGMYHFDNVPLYTGLNEFRLVFYGPQGQRREEVQRFNVGSSLTPPGESRYRISAGVSQEGSPRFVSQYDLGLLPQLSASVGSASLPLFNGGRQSYGQVGLRGFQDEVFVHADLAASDQGGFAGEVGGQTRLGPADVSARYSGLNRFASEAFPQSSDPLTQRVILTVNSNNGFPLHPLFSTGLTCTRDLLQSGLSLHRLSNRFSARYQNLFLTNQLGVDVSQEDAGTFRPTPTGMVQLGAQWSPLGLRGDLYYFPREMQGGGLSLNANLPQKFFLNCGATYLLSTAQPQFNVNVNKDMGAYMLGINVSDSLQGGFVAGLALSSSIGLGQAQGSWFSSSRSAVNNGAASVLVFMDKNRNGRKDEGESLQEGVEVLVDGNARGRTGEDGVAMLTDLPSYQAAQVSLSVETLEDPLWVPKEQGYRLIPRPGSVTPLEFPLLATAEVSGFVRLNRQGRLEEIGGLELELIDSAGRVACRARTGYDGFFAHSGVAPGHYKLKISPEQLTRLGVSSSGERIVDVSEDGGAIDVNDLILEVAK